ncbi:MAG: UDP-N-acetylglucosamine 2-epimerase, partial [Alphaproteobacteria bacterium]
LDGVCKALAAVVDARPDVEVVLPVHRNPRVARTVEAALGDRDRVRLVEPLGYAEFQSALRQSHLVLTDSGGVQEEAPTWGVPVLVARRTTERSEAVAAGVASLVGLDGARIERAMLDLLDDPAAHEAMRARSNPFGDGAAAARIAARIADDLGAAPSEDAAAAAVA